MASVDGSVGGVAAIAGSAALSAPTATLQSASTARLEAAGATSAPDPVIDSTSHGTGTVAALKDALSVCVNKSERMHKAESRIEQDPYDGDAWNALLAEARISGDAEVQRACFERLLRRFPTSAKHWRAYAEYEVRMGAYDRVEKVFERCLLSCLNVDLWKSYLAYVRDTKSGLPNFRDVMTKAYIFAVEHIGLDIGSQQIWHDYIEFLKSGEATGPYEEGLKMDAVRKAFQGAVVNPISGIEQLWKAYDQYENNLNKLTARKILHDRSAAYMTARSVCKERKTLLDAIQPPVLPMPPTGTQREAAQVQAWRKYINYERSNPLRLDDTNAVVDRVLFAYNQCILSLFHYPAIWHEAAQYLSECGKKDQASAMYERGLQAVPESLLLHFSFAEFEESRLNNDRARKLYEDLLASPRLSDPTLVYVQFMRFLRRSDGIKPARALFTRARKDTRAQWHVYAASALMEFYMSKDASIAFKIFDLGLKQHASSEEYIRAYLDHMTHLNEENNTRVLFERVLTSLPPEKAAEVWSQFLRFEVENGTLTNVASVEKRCVAALSKAVGDSIALKALVDRYCFMGLQPCSAEELRAFGVELSTDRAVYGEAEGFVHAQHKESLPIGHDIAKSDFVLPDVSLMVPFRPEVMTPSGIVGDQGIPEAVAALLRVLPAPQSFTGPFLNPDELLHILAKTNLPPPPPGVAAPAQHSHQPTTDVGMRLPHMPPMRSEEGGGFSPRLRERDPRDSHSGQPAPPGHAGQQGRPRRKRGASESDEEGGQKDAPYRPPAHDLFRNRQQRRLNQ